VNALTEGGRLVGTHVARLGAAEVARRVKTSEAMARHLATGRKTPGSDLKQRLADTFGISLESWAQAAAPEPPPAPKRPTADKPASAATKKGSALELLWGTVTMVDEALDGLDVEAPATHRASLLQRRIDALDKIAKLQGEGELTPAMVLRSRAWRELMARIEPILTEYPDVATKIAEAIEAVEG
jgi:hypothetical protein